MQTRRMMVALLASIAVFYLWMLIAARIWPHRPTTRPADVASTQPATATAPAFAEAEQPLTRSAATSPGIAGPSRPGLKVAGGDSVQPVTLGNAADASQYPMELEISPIGGSVIEASLRKHYETVKKEVSYRVVEPVATPQGDLFRSFTTTKIRFENANVDVPLGDVAWEVSPESTSERTVLTATINDNGRPLARIVKTYTLRPQPASAMTYDLGLSIRVENLSDQNERVVLVQQGPVGFRKEEPRSEDRKVLVGSWLANGNITVTGYLRDKVAKEGEIPLGKDEGENRVAWAAETNKYFTCIMTPAGRQGLSDVARFAQVKAVHLASQMAAEERNGEHGAMTFQFVTVPIPLTPGASAETAFNCYLGPKSKRAFQKVDEYRRLNYYGAIKESFYACAPAGLVSLMMSLLDFFHAIVRNYGVAIIILVLVVRTILHPITKKSQVNMMKMQKQMSTLQPKIEAVKTKYANDRVAMNQAMMEVYREAGVNPAGNLLTCLPLLLQIPIWGALWTALSSTIEMRHAPFDGYWIRDLAGPDAVITFAHAYNVPIISWLAGPIHSINILPVLLGISQLLQTKYMPRGTPSAQSGGNPDQLEQQRKMMMFMSVFFVFMLYNAPSGLNLYIMASNMFGILEQWRIRKHIAEEEQRQGAEPPKPKGPRQPGWLERKWSELQKQAEEARKLDSQRPQQKKGKTR